MVRALACLYKRFYIEDPARFLNNTQHTNWFLRLAKIMLDHGASVGLLNDLFLETIREAIEKGNLNTSLFVKRKLFELLDQDKLSINTLKRMIKALDTHEGIRSTL